MQVNFPGFIGPAYESKSWKASAQRCVNLYLEPDPEKGSVLFGTPGTRLVGTLVGPILSLMETPSGLIAVSSASLQMYSGYSGGLLQPGTIFGSISASSYVSMCQAGSFVMLTNGTNGYWIDRDSSSSPSPIDVIGGFPANPSYCTALDGRFIVNRPGSDSFNWSAPFDPTSWDALDFASAENLNDSLMRPIVLERELYLIGQQSTEVWASVATDEVFARIQGTYIPYGTIAPETAAVIGQSLLWLSRDQNGQGIVIRVKGLQANRVSTHAIEEEISTYSSISDAYAFVYQQQGHEFYVLSFPTAKKTWVFDLTTSAWHERTSMVYVDDPITPPPREIQQQHHIGRCHAFFQGMNIIGSRENGDIYALDPSMYSEATGGDTNPLDIVRTRTSPHAFANGEYHTINRIEFGLQPGVGIPYEVGATREADQSPLAMFRISKDGGQNWGTQRTATMGEQGKYKTRIGFNRCGRARDFVAELSISSHVFVAVTSAQIDASK
jgi:hypothetical protein